MSERINVYMMDFPIDGLNDRQKKEVERKYM